MSKYKSEGNMWAGILGLLIFSCSMFYLVTLNFDKLEDTFTKRITALEKVHANSATERSDLKEADWKQNRVLWDMANAINSIEPVVRIKDLEEYLGCNEKCH
jgi:hypothetical protein